jgi:thioester reductase-like protein
MKKNILLTGVTGLLGRYILREIIENEDSTVYLLIRGNNLRHSENRFLNIVKNLWGGEINKIKNRIQILNGSIEDSMFCLDKKVFNILRDKITEVFHGAAATGFNLSLENARKTNVSGTENIMNFAVKCKNIQKVNYVSTMFIKGKSTGVFMETDSLHNIKDFGFNNYYEQSKYEAETVVEKYKRNILDLSIFRPSIIVGEYLTGKTSSFKMFYEPLRFFSKGFFKDAPANIKSMHNVIPVDVAARSIYLLSRNGKKSKIYHVVSPNDMAFGEFISLAGSFFRFTLPHFTPDPSFNYRLLTFIQKRMIEPFIPYLNYQIIFNGDLTINELKSEGFRLPYITSEYLTRIFEFCNKVGFVKKNENKQ